MDMKVIMNIINWTFEKMGETAWNDAAKKGVSLNMGKMSEQSDLYIEALRNAFYKQVEITKEDE
jgi:hypothetical protein